MLPLRSIDLKRNANFHHHRPKKLGESSVLARTQWRGAAHLHFPDKSVPGHFSRDQRVGSGTNQEGPIQIRYEEEL
jgi:hypothetical protein